MRSIYYGTAILIIIFSSACATLNKAEIKNSDRVEFEPLRLKPGIETTDLRLDLIRDDYVEKVNDSASKTVDEPYHPLGFDLGNGIFYDLNENLCFRLDELMGVAGEDCYSLKKNIRVNKKRADYIYSFCHDTLTVIYPPWKREHYVNHRISYDGTTEVMFRNRFLYAVDLEDNKSVYRGKRRNRDVIERVDENHYYQRQGFRKDHFELHGNQVLLKRDYIIELKDGNKRIEILRPGMFGNRILFTLEQNRDNLYIYDRRYSGRRIHFTDEGISIYRDRKLITRWSL